MKCCQCGKIIEDDSRFCEFCGARQGYSEQLIQDAICGKEQAIRELYNRTYVEVYQMVKSMIRDEDAALNLIQDAYVLGFHNLHRLKNASDYERWIKRIAQNKMAGYLRKKKPDVYGNITGEDVERIVTYSNEKTENHGQLKPNQRLLELIENECVYEKESEEVPRGSFERKTSGSESSDRKASDRKPSGNKRNGRKKSSVSKAVLIILILAFVAGGVAALLPWGERREDVLRANPTPQPVVEATPTPILGGSALATPTSRPTAVPTPSPEPTEEPQIIVTPEPTEDPQLIVIPEPTAIPQPTAAPEPVATPTPIPAVPQEPEQSIPEEEPLFEETIVHEETFYTE